MNSHGGALRQEFDIAFLFERRHGQDLAHQRHKDLGIVSMALFAAPVADKTVLSELGRIGGVPGLVMDGEDIGEQIVQ